MLTILDETLDPVLGALLARLRCAQAQKDRARFRDHVRLIGLFLAQEVGRGLPSHLIDVQTPLGLRKQVVPESSPVLATALRAGLPLIDGFLEVFCESDVSFFGAARVEGAGPDSEGAIPIAMGYEALSPLCGRDLIFCDPMVATGSTIIDILARLDELELTPRSITIAGVVGWRGAAKRLAAAAPKVRLVLATCDDELDERGYIVPGLGDAGDLMYGPKI